MEIKCTLFFCLIFWSVSCFAQKEFLPKTPEPLFLSAPSTSLNYSSITTGKLPVSRKWKQHNPEFLSHPDAGYSAKEQPAKNAIEILEKRTEFSRFYIDADSSTKVYSQGSYGALHYKKNGQWLIIDSRLNKSNGLLEASHQIEPVGFDPEKKKSFIKTINGILYFNDWKLLGKLSKGEKLLAEANWDNLKAGDDGIFVKNIFPGVDAEMQVLRGRIKTNLIVREWKFSGYENYIFSDNFQASATGNFSFVNSAQEESGVGELDFSSDGKLLARIGKAVLYAERDAENAVFLPYSFQKQRLGITVNENILKTLLQKGKVIIDPLVTGADGILNSGALLNSYNNANCKYDFNEGCSYEWNVPVPADVSITNTTVMFQIITRAPCTRDKMRWIYRFGTNGCGGGVTWSAINLPVSPGITSGSGSADRYNSCFTSGCTQQDIKVSMSILRACMGPDGCESTCVQGVTPFVVTIIGRSLEVVSLSTAPEITKCPGETVTLSASADFGIKPYTYQWSPANKEGNSIEVNPLASTNYTVTVKDACGQAVTASKQVTVTPGLPPASVEILASETEICEGSVINFSSVVTNGVLPSYQWTVNGTAVTGANTNKFSSSGLNNQDVVKLIVTNTDACAVAAASNELKITVHTGKIYPQEMTITGCNSLLFGGKIYYDNIEISDTLVSRFGCDSVSRQISIIIEKFDLLLSLSNGQNYAQGENIDLLTSSNINNYTITSWEPKALFTDQHALTQQIQASNNSKTFTVNGESTAGCKDSASVTVNVTDIPLGDLLPSAFSPNGDGLNDVWAALKTDAFPVGELFIYNRWGQIIYHTEDYKIPWNGMYENEKVAAGVYPYRLIISKKYKYNGSVTILY